MTNSHSIPIGPQAKLPACLQVVVTGVASGIGQAQTQAFLDQGHKVYGIDLKASACIDQWKQDHPDHFEFIQVDLSKQANCQQVIDHFKAKYDQLDVLCNTAGQLDDFRPLDQVSFDQWDQIMQTNLYSIFYLTKGFLPYLLQNPSSRLINMASIASLTAGGGGLAYTTSKHAIAGFTKQMAYDYSSMGLRANAIAPGAIATPMNQADFQGEATMAQWVANQTPVKRWASPEEVAQLTLFLASDASDYLSGAVIPLDGGWMIR